MTAYCTSYGSPALPFERPLQFVCMADGAAAQGMVQNWASSDELQSKPCDPRLKFHGKTTVRPPGAISMASFGQGQRLTSNAKASVEARSGIELFAPETQQILMRATS